MGRRDRRGCSNPPPAGGRGEETCSACSACQEGRDGRGDREGASPLHVPRELGAGLKACRSMPPAGQEGPPAAADEAVAAAAGRDQAAAAGRDQAAAAGRDQAAGDRDTRGGGRCREATRTPKVPGPVVDGVLYGTTEMKWSRDCDA